METLKHYTECLDKKIIGDCIIEQNYNEAIAEIKMLTGRDLLYIDNDVLCSSCAYHHVI